MLDDLLMAHVITTVYFRIFKIFLCANDPFFGSTKNRHLSCSSRDDDGAPSAKRKEGAVFLTFSILRLCSWAFSYAEIFWNKHVDQARTTMGASCQTMAMAMAARAKATSTSAPFRNSRCLAGVCRDWRITTHMEVECGPDGF